MKSFRLKTFLDWKIDNKTPNLCWFHSHWTAGKVTYTFVVFLTSATSLCKPRYENDLVCIILETEQYVIDYANSLSILLSISVYKLSRLTSFLDQRKRSHLKNIISVINIQLQVNWFIFHEATPYLSVIRAFKFGPNFLNINKCNIQSFKFILIYWFTHFSIKTQKNRFSY